MNQKLHLLFAIAVILMGLTACQKSTKDQLVGTWHCVKSISAAAAMVQEKSLLNK